MNSCTNCLHEMVEGMEEPCGDCNERSHWEPKTPEVPKDQPKMTIDGKYVIKAPIEENFSTDGMTFHDDAPYLKKIEYVKKWGMKEAFREFIQNSLDNTEECFVTIDEEKHRVIIRDHGTGFPLDRLLFGVSIKDEEKVNRGEHGEGMKLSFIAATRLGYKIIMYTTHEGKNYVFTPAWHEKFGVQCFKIDVHLSSTAIKGTKVVMQLNNEEMRRVPEYLDQFTFFSQPEVIHEQNGQQVFRGPGGKVSVKGIAADNVNSHFSVNLIMDIERDRSAMSHSEISSRMDDLLSSCPNEEVIRELLGITDMTLMECEIYLWFDYRAKKIWEELHGAKAVILDDNDLREKMIHRYYTPVIVPDQWDHGLNRIGIKLASQVMREEHEEFMQKDKYKVSTKVINKEQRKNLKSALKLSLKAVNAHYKRRRGGEEITLLQLHEIVRLYKNSSTAAGYASGGIAHLKISELDAFKSTMDTLMHELCHVFSHLSDGARFGTELGAFNAALITEMRKQFMLREK